MGRNRKQDQNQNIDGQNNQQQQNLSGEEVTTPITEGTVETPAEEQASAGDVVDGLDLNDDSTIGDPATEV
jgi:hypothetical protein